MEKDKAAKEKPGTQPVPNHSTSKPDAYRTPSGVGCGQALKIHLKKAMQGLGWTHVEPKDPGPDVGQCYKPPK